jgi:Ni/Fe-hydrogenase subunit HybB-like protein
VADAREEPGAATLSFGEITDTVMAPLRPPRRSYYIATGLLALGICWATVWWIAQVKIGMGISGLSIPVGWAFYITNFVFWIGIGHAGTLISAILHLVRSRWRTAISRSAEAMTIFAVLTAGLFPLIHLGRVWVVYYIIPYPSERQLWPDFMSPLVWDVCAVTTYLTVSIIFWFVGIIPDLAAARDHWELTAGPDHPRTRLCRALALGWSGSGNQWQHHGRGYLFFAALATPLVISVHSVVSWDFAMGQLPGWHTTIFAPYFVAGAIHSGLAMVLVLLIPMRRLLKLERVMTVDHFEAVAQMMIVTGLVVGYAYIIEPFISWYSGDIFERQFAFWRATGWIAPFFWALAVCNVLAPLAFLWKRLRRSIPALLVVAILVNIGMWVERFVIIAGSTSHDFMPHNWHAYAPRPVEISITIGAFCFFLFWFFIFARLAPTVSISDVKEDQAEGVERYTELDTDAPPIRRVRRTETGLVAVFQSREPLLEALKKAREGGFERIETYSPVRLREAERILGRGPSPVRHWTLVGAVCGVTGGFALAIGAALVNGLIVGGKHPVSLIPYCIVGFEGLILLGAIGNLLGVLYHARLGRWELPRSYDRRFGKDRFGLFLECGPERLAEARTILSSVHTEEIREVG